MPKGTIAGTVSGVTMIFDCIWASDSQVRNGCSKIVAHLGSPIKHNVSKKKNLNEIKSYHHYRVQIISTTKHLINDGKNQWSKTWWMFLDIFFWKRVSNLSRIFNKFEEIISIIPCGRLFQRLADAIDVLRWFYAMLEVFTRLWPNTLSKTEGNDGGCSNHWI